MIRFSAAPFYGTLPSGGYRGVAVASRSTIKLPLNTHFLEVWRPFQLLTLDISVKITFNNTHIKHLPPSDLYWMPPSDSYWIPPVPVK